MNPTHLIERVLSHARKGTLKTVLRRKFNALTGGGTQVNRFAVREAAEAPIAIAELSQRACSQPGQAVLVFGEANDFSATIQSRLKELGRPSRLMSPNAAATLAPQALADIGCIAIASLDSQVQLKVARHLVRNPAAAMIPLEYLALPHVENAALRRYNRLDNEDFVAPLVAEFGSAFYDIYKRSLERFRQKTEIRDYFDFSQMLRSLLSREVPGNVAEFGSYQGHSGWLMSNVLEQFGSDKTLFMFDMFENFPAEDIGVDRFWSGTHQVDFDAVRARFTDRANVRLVKGDFTRTLLETDTGPLAFAFIDCDSYRATRFLLEHLWEHRTPVGGIVAMEDYGHAALLGNRVAVHEFFDGRRDAYTWYSQFSGIFVAVKMN